MTRARSTCRLGIGGAVLALGLPISARAQQTDSLSRQKGDTTMTPGVSPLIIPTASHLRRGEFVLTLRNRVFNTGGVVSGLPIQPTAAGSLGITNGLEIILDAQTVDNGGPGRQGPFIAERNRASEGKYGGSLFHEYTLQAKQHVLGSRDAGLAVSVAPALSHGYHLYVFYDSLTKERVKNGPEPIVEYTFSLDVPATLTSGRGRYTLTPRVAFLPEQRALFLRTMPIANAGKFGTLAGVAPGVWYRALPRLDLWGDAFVPIVGNNTINRTTGYPARIPAFNAGARLAVHPSLAAELFVSNALGNTGALSMTADREHQAIGASVIVLPFAHPPAQEWETRERAGSDAWESPRASIGLSEAATLRARTVAATVHGGTQGNFESVRVGVVEDLELGAYLENVAGVADESEWGASAGLRLMAQEDGRPFTLTMRGTAAMSNNVLINLLSGTSDELQRRGWTKSGFQITHDDIEQGRVYMLSLAVPVQRAFDGGRAAWLMPAVGYVQRKGVQVAGVSAGASTPLAAGVSASAELGADLSGKGNMVRPGERVSAVPWTGALSWRPPGASRWSSALRLDAYLTNRVGRSPFHDLRVRSGNDVAFGLGASVVVPARGK